MSRALEQFIERAGFPYGWSNLESSGRRMAEQAVKELDHQAAVIRDLLAFWRSFDGAVFDEIQHPALDAAKALAGFQPEVTPIVRADQWTPEELAEIAARGPTEPLTLPTIDPIRGMYWDSLIGAADKALATPELCTTPARVSRWKCPKCGSPRVQVGLPAWFREYGPISEGSELEYVEPTEYVEPVDGADVMWWYCEACEVSEIGLPELNEDAP